MINANRLKAKELKTMEGNRMKINIQNSGELLNYPIS